MISSNLSQYINWAETYLYDWKDSIWELEWNGMDKVVLTEASTQYELFVKDATFGCRTYSWLKNGRPNVAARQQLIFNYEWKSSDR